MESRKNLTLESMGVKEEENEKKMLNTFDDESDDDVDDAIA